jgi:hypothetical protein
MRLRVQNAGCCGSSNSYGRQLEKVAAIAAACSLVIFRAQKSGIRHDCDLPLRPYFSTEGTSRGYGEGVVEVIEATAQDEIAETISDSFNQTNRGTLVCFSATARTTAMLRAYLDESGTHRDIESFVAECEKAEKTGGAQ